MGTSGRSNAKEQRNQKGEVSVIEDRGWLRLRWRVDGKRYALSLGLPVSRANRAIAEQKAEQIEDDIKWGRFDPTLTHYKPQKINPDALPISTLFQLFIDHKSKTISDRTLDKYRAVLKHLEDFFKEKPAIWLGQRSDRLTPGAEAFLGYLESKVGPVACKTYLILLNACWVWGIKNAYVKSNPWTGLLERVKVPPKQPPKPFSREEIGAIIQAFRTDRYYNYYGDYVEFLFGTGCRTAEAIGLRWKHLADDCSSAWIGESPSRGVRKSTKTNKARVVTLTPKLQEMLLARKPDGAKPDDLVFTTPRGGAIDDHNFRNRAWKPILIRLEIDYRRPYTTRHTLISHALDLGMNPVMVAQLTGHDIQTLYQNYAGNGNVNSKPRLPKLSFKV